jgi:hypothetical protein
MSKLIKRTNGRYDLYSDDINQINTIASTQHELNVSKLSIRNCESISNGYDLDELAKEYSKGKSSSNVFREAHEEDFKKGFQKALELLVDKKFSEDKQTEWDVEIKLDEITTDDISSIIGKPKFDSDGCLILKRK